MKSGENGTQSCCNRGFINDHQCIGLKNEKRGTNWTNMLYCSREITMHFFELTEDVPLNETST